MKDDYLRECLTEVSAKAKQSVPLDDFQREFCLYCYNKQCSRSGTSTSFDRRTDNWYKDKFLDVPRAKDDDSRFVSVKSSWASAALSVPVRKMPSFDPIPVHTPSKFEPLSNENANPPVNSQSVPLQVSSLPSNPTTLGDTWVGEIKSELDETTNVVPPVQVTSPIADADITPPTPVQTPIQTPPPVLLNTPFDSAMYVGEKKDQEKIYQPGDTFTFGEEEL